MVERIRIRGHIIRFRGVTPSTSSSPPECCPQCNASFDGGPFRKCEYLCCTIISCYDCAKHRNVSYCEQFYEEMQRNKKSRPQLFDDTYLAVVTLYSDIKCHVCDKNFTKKSSLTNHMRTHKDKNMEPSQETTQEQKSLQDPVTNKKKIPNFRCRQCPMQFSCSKYLIIHKRKCHIIKPFNCIFCKKSFNRQGNMDDHIRNHIREKVHICPVCHEEFSTTKGLKKHVFNYGHFHKIPKRVTSLRRSESTEETTLKISKVEPPEELSNQNSDNEGERENCTPNLICPICYRIINKTFFHMHLRSHPETHIQQPELIVIDA